MSDDLVKRLRRRWPNEDPKTQAEKREAAARIEGLEAKLAKAVGAMEFWMEAQEPDIDEAINLMQATLAELKGEIGNE